MQEISKFFNLDEPDVLKIMTMCDTNHDNKIEYTEFVTAAFDKQKLLSKENIRRAFDLLDTDCNNTISTEELRQAFGNPATADQSAKFW